MRRILLILSLLPVLGFITYEPASSLPEYTLIKVSLPTYGSVITLKARALKGSSSLGLLCISTSESFGSKPEIAPISNGEGKKSLTASSNRWTPLFLNADPHKVGTKVLSKQPLRIASFNSSSVISFSSRYFSSKFSS